MLLTIEQENLKALLERAFEFGVDFGYQELGSSDLGRVIPENRIIDKNEAIKIIINDFMSPPEDKVCSGKTTVTVCNKCLRASCWLGKFYCEEYLTAGVVEKTKDELAKLDLEHPHYWDYEDGV